MSPDLKLTTVSLPDLAWPQRNRARIVLVQPKLELERDGAVRLRPDTVELRKQLVWDALAVTGRQGATFLVLPEYSLPAQLWPEVEQKIAAELPRNTVVMAGLDGLTPEEYRVLMEGVSHPPHTPTDTVPANRWVNCCVVWAKDGDGPPKRFVQAKAGPAPAEYRPAGMYHGNRLFVFETRHCRFAVLLCYDLIHPLDGLTPLPIWLSEQVNERVIGHLQLLFLLEQNGDPENRAFLEVKQDTFVMRHVDAILVANGADHGISGMYFPNGSFKRPDVAQDTFCLDEKMPGWVLSRAHFRNHAEAIFSFDYYPVPANLPRGGPQLPMRDAFEHEVRPDGTRDLDGKRVSPWAWVLANFGPPGHPDRHPPPLPVPALQARFVEQFAAVKTAMAKVSDPRLEELHSILFCVPPPGGPQAPDMEPMRWTEFHQAALGKMMRTAALLRFGSEIPMNRRDRFATLRLPDCADRPVAIVASSQDVPPEAAMAEFRRFLNADHLTPPPDLVVLLLDHPPGWDQTEPEPVEPRTEAEDRIASEPEVAYLEGTDQTAGADRSHVSERNPSSMALPVLSGSMLQKLLTASKDIDEAACRVREVFA